MKYLMSLPSNFVKMLHNKIKYGYWQYNSIKQIKINNNNDLKLHQTEKGLTIYKNEGNKV